METNFKDNQSRIIDNLPSIGVPSDTKTQVLNDAINRRETFAGQLLASLPADTNLNIGASSITLADGRVMKVPNLDGIEPQLSATTIDPINNTDGGGFAPFDYPVALAAGEFVKMGFVLQSNGSIRVLFNKLSGVAGGDGELPFPSDSGTLNLGYIRLVSIAAGTSYKSETAATDIIDNPDIIQLLSSSGGGDDSDSAKIPADGFRAMITDKFPSDPTQDDSKAFEDYTTAEHLTAEKMYQIECDKSLTVTTTVVSSGNNEVQRLSYGGVQSISGSYQIVFDGETTVAISSGSSNFYIESVLEDLPNVDDVSVVGDDINDFLITFKGILSDTDVPLMTIINNSLQSSGGAIVPAVTEDTAGSTGEVQFALSAAPSFTVAVGDVIYSGDTFRRISEVLTTSTGKIDSPFPTPLTATSCMVSQSVWTKDLINGIGSATDKTRIIDFFPEADIDKVHVEYQDSLIVGDVVGDFVDEARVVSSVSSSGGRHEESYPLSDTFNSIYTRPTSPEDILDYTLSPNRTQVFVENGTISTSGTALNTTTQEELSQPFSASEEGSLGSVELSLFKIGFPSGKVLVKIIKDDGTGNPSAALSDVVHSHEVDITLLPNSDIAPNGARNDISYEADGDTPAGLYHIKIEGDSAYQSSHSAGVSEITVMFGATSEPDALHYNGVAWQTISAGSGFKFKVSLNQGFDDRAFAVFFCNPNNSNVSSSANLIKYEISLVTGETLSEGGVLDSSFAMSDGSGVTVNSSQPTVFTGNTEWNLGFSFVPGVNAGKTAADFDVKVDGLHIPRKVQGSTLDAWWEPVYGSTTKIRFWADLSGSQLSLEAIKRQGVIETDPLNSLHFAVPSGGMIPFGGIVIPSGWLACDGSQISRTGYPSLFTALGTYWGNGDGSTTFHIPDTRGRVLRGVDGGEGTDPEAAARFTNTSGNTGDNVGSLQDDSTALPKNLDFTTNSTGDHTHETVNSNSAAGAGKPASGGDAPEGANHVTLPAGDHWHTVVGGDLETRMKNAYVNYIIKI